SGWRYGGGIDVLDWLLDSDPAIRWQVLRDLADADATAVAAERARVAREGLRPAVVRGGAVMQRLDAAPVHGVARTALITGGNRGIGQQVARVLARDGWDVLIAARDRKKGDTAAARLRKETGGRLRAVEL